jgi:hypothetical protein
MSVHLSQVTKCPTDFSGIYEYYRGIYTERVSNLVLVRTDQLYVNLLFPAYENRVIVQNVRLIKIET